MCQVIYIIFKYHVYSGTESEMNSLADDAELNSPGEILHTDTSPNVVSVNLILKTTRVTELLILTFLGCEKKAERE